MFAPISAGEVSWGKFIHQLCISCLTVVCWRWKILLYSHRVRHRKSLFIGEKLANYANWLISNNNKNFTLIRLIEFFSFLLFYSLFFGWAQKKLGWWKLLKTVAIILMHFFCCCANPATIFFICMVGMKL